MASFRSSCNALARNRRLKPCLPCLGVRRRLGLPERRRARGSHAQHARAYGDLVCCTRARSLQLLRLATSENDNIYCATKPSHTLRNFTISAECSRRAAQRRLRKGEPGRGRGRRAPGRGAPLRWKFHPDPVPPPRQRAGSAGDAPGTTQPRSERVGPAVSRLRGRSSRGEQTTGGAGCLARGAARGTEQKGGAGPDQRARTAPA